MKLNSRNLVMSAMFGGRRGPRPAAGNPTSIACHELMDKAGVSFPAAHVDASAMAELALAGHELVGFDTVMPEYSVVQEAAAMGAQVDWGDRDKMPDVKAFPNADFSEVTVPADLLEKPACRVVLDALSILRRHARDIEARLGARIAVRRVAVRDPGKERMVDVDRGLLTTRYQDLLDDPSISVVVELVGGTGAAWIVSLATAGVLDVPDDAPGYWTEAGGELGAALDGAARDLDGDGLDDVALADPASAGAVYLLGVFP